MLEPASRQTIPKGCSSAMVSPAGLAISSELSQISETSLYLSNQSMTELEECLGIVSYDIVCDKVFMPYSADRQAMIKSMDLTKKAAFYVGIRGNGCAFSFDDIVLR